MKWLACWLAGAAVLLALAVSVSASDFKAAVTLNGVSLHLADRDHNRLNERNYGAGVEIECVLCVSESGKYVGLLAVGEYRNSNDRDSWYAGVGWKRRFLLTPQFDHLRLDVGVALLAVTGYLESSAVVPALLPILYFGGEHIGINVTYIPPLHPDVVPAIAVQLRIRVFDIFEVFGR